MLLPNRIFRKTDVRKDSDLKIMPEFTSEFVLEAKKMIDPNHPYITPHYIYKDTGWMDFLKTCCFSLIAEKIIGKNLHQVIVDSQPLNRQQIMQIVNIGRIDTYYKRKLGIGLFPLNILPYSKVNDINYNFFIEANLQRSELGLSGDVLFDFLQNPHVKEFMDRDWSKVSDHYIATLDYFLTRKLEFNPPREEWPFDTPKEVDCKCGKKAVAKQGRFGAYYICACGSSYPLFAEGKPCPNCHQPMQTRMARAFIMVDCCNRCERKVEVG